MSGVPSTAGAGARGALSGPRAGGWPARYEMLDAWRGLAAVAVVLHHLGLGHAVNVGHNAVAIFFVISGYCVTAAAQNCLRKGVGLGRYLARRLRRIYPPYVLALLFFIATRLVKSGAGLGETPGGGVVYWLQNFTLTQWLSLVAAPASFAAENPTLAVAAFWSLNYEEQFYLVVGLLLLAARWRGWGGVLKGLAALMVVGVAWNLLLPARSFGFFVEYWVLFGSGGLVYFRLCGGLSDRGRVAVDLALVSLLLAAVGGATVGGYGWGITVRSAYAEWAVGAAFALLLVGLRGWSPTFAATLPGRALMKLGTITYSLYLIHQFNLRSASVVVAWLLPAGSPGPLVVAGQLCFLIGLSTVFWYFCERPFLNESLTPAVAPELQGSGERGS